MSKYLNVPNGDYKVSVKTGGTIYLNTGFDTGATIAWNFAPAADDGAVEMEEAGDDDSFTNAADFEVDGD